METTFGKIRNVTSGILHTNIGDVYEFYDQYLDAPGIMTHHIPSAFKALQPILKNKLDDKWFTDEWIKEGLDEAYVIPDLTQEEKNAFWVSFGIYAGDLWDSIKDKTITVKL